MKIIYYIAVLVMVTACQEGTQKNKANSTSGKKATTKNVIESNIEEMGKKPWNKAEYLEIKEKQITLLKRMTEKDALGELLDNVYGKVLVRDANNLIDNDCTQKLLETIMAELKHFPKAVGLAELTKRKRQLDEQKSFIHSLSRMVAVSDFKQKYDKEFDEAKIQEARRYLAQNPSCPYIRRNLENPRALLKKRHHKYCQQITELYLAKNEYYKIDENRILTNLESMESQFDINISQWVEQVERFRKEKEIIN